MKRIFTYLSLIIFLTGCNGEKDLNTEAEERNIKSDIEENIKSEKEVTKDIATIEQSKELINTNAQSNKDIYNAYIVELSSIFLPIIRSSGEILEMDFEQGNSIIIENKLEDIRENLNININKLNTMEYPSELEEAHTLFLEAASKYQVIAEIMPIALSKKDAENLSLLLDSRTAYNEAVALYYEGMEKVELLIEEN